MALEEARRVIWQTHPKEPMGDLFDYGRRMRGRWVAPATAYRSVTLHTVSIAQNVSQRLL